MKLHFKGFGNNIFGEDLSLKKYHANIIIGKPITWRVISEKRKESLLVVGQFNIEYIVGWLIGVARDWDRDEEAPMPNWFSYYEPDEDDHSLMLRMIVPDNCRMELVSPDGRKE